MSASVIGTTVPVSAATDIFLQLFEISAGLECLVDAGWIKEGANRIGGKVWRSPHPLSGKLPIGKIVALQLNKMSVKGAGCCIVLQ